MEGFQTIHVDDMKEGDLRITGITAEVENSSPDNVQLSFNEEKNGLNVVVDQTHIKIHVHWKYKKSILKFSGTGDISGPLSHLAMVVGFETQEKEGMLIPKINIQDFQIDLQKSKWNFKFKCGACISKVNDLILKAFQGPLVDKIKSEAKKVVNNKIADTINAKFLSIYPLSLSVTDQISISTATTDVIQVKEEYLSVPFDASIFLTNEGYSRSTEAPVIPSENPENPGEIVLFASTYMFEGLEAVINKIPMTFEKSIMGLNLIVKIDGSVNPLGIKTKDKVLNIQGGAVISIPTLSIEVEIAASAELDFKFKPGDGTNTLYVDPDIIENTVKFSTFDFSLFGHKLNLGFALPVVDYIFTFIMDTYVFSTIAIPKQETLPLTATSALISFFEEYTEAGIAFNFSQDY